MKMKLSLLVALAAVALLTGGCQVTHSGSLRIDPALEALIPADTAFIAFANIDKIRTTAVYQKYMDKLDLKGMTEFTQETGLDPRKDLWQILSCSNGKSALFMARGKFSTAELEPKLEAKGAKRFSYKGHNVYGDDQRALMFLNSSTAVAGTLPALRALIDDHDHSIQGLPPALKQQVDSIPAASQIWVASTGGLHGFDAGVPEGSNLGNVLQILRGIDSATVGLDLSNGLSLAARATCHTDNDARHVHDAVRGVVGFGRLSTPTDRQELFEVYDSVKVDQKQNQVLVSAQVSPKLVDEFVGQWLKNR